MFTINDKEKETIQMYENALKITFGAEYVKQNSYIFSARPNGIGQHIEFEFKVWDVEMNKSRIFRYDITDYGSW